MKAFGKNREDIQLLIFFLESAIMYTYIYIGYFLKWIIFKNLKPK